MAIDSEHAAAILWKIFESGSKSDLITLIASNGGQRMPIHRVVLTANTKHFVPATNFRKAEENEFILDGTDGPTLKAIVAFCYTGRIDLTEENVSKYLAIASGVELCLLEQKCFRFLADKLNRNNAVRTLLIADMYSGHVLRQKTLEFVCELFDELPLPHIDELDNRSLKEILKSDAIHAEEQFVFDRVLSWFRKDQGDRGQFMTELLILIRLPLIPSQYLSGDKMEIIYKEFGCLEYMNAECKLRIACPTSNAGSRRRRSVYCLFKQYFDDRAGAGEQSGVKIERYISALNELEGVGEIELGQRTYFGAILHENKVYVFGGEIDHVARNSVSVFDLTSGEERVLPEMTSARSSFASILIGKFIYVFGGCDELTNERLSSCERFDLEAETWKTLKPMSVARSGAAVAELNGYIYVAGGYNLARLDAVNDVELFDPQNDEWITLEPIDDARHCFDLLASKNYLYAMGGYESTIERYDPLTTRWTKTVSFESCKDIFSTIVVNDNIYAIKKNGEFGEVKIDENGGCSFISIAKSKFKAAYSWRHLLFRE